MPDEQNQALSPHTPPCTHGEGCLCVQLKETVAFLLADGPEPEQWLARLQMARDILKEIKGTSVWYT